MNGNTYLEIKEYVDGLTICDTHEHLPRRETDGNADILCEYLGHYFSSDLISSGMPRENFQKLLDCEISLKERWKLAKPWWEFSRKTGYGRVLDIAAKDLYGFEKIDEETIEPLGEAFKKNYKGRFERVLKEKSKIAISVLDNIFDNSLDSDKRYFASVFRLAPFVTPRNGETVKYVGKEYGIEVKKLSDFLDAAELAINKAVEEGAIAYKIPIAYVRSLDIGAPTFEEAEGEFMEYFLNPKCEINFDGPSQFAIIKKLTDYILNFTLDKIKEKGLPVQIHTGLLEGNGNIIQNTNPALLCPLLWRYPENTFDLFHMGYPYQSEMSAVVKMFPNAMLDMCWAHIISPAASVFALNEFLDTVPYNKISAFGGDYLFVDGVYGHQKIARENVSKALAQKVCDGSFDISEAKHIAKSMFYGNPVRIFNLQNKIV